MTSPAVYFPTCPMPAEPFTAAQLREMADGALRQRFVQHLGDLERKIASAASAGYFELGHDLPTIYPRPWWSAAFVQMGQRGLCTIEEPGRVTISWAHPKPPPPVQPQPSRLLRWWRSL